MNSSSASASTLQARIALLAGNFITGIVVLAPAGMLQILAEGLQVSIRDAGLLITYGAVVLCIASPLVSWATARVGRRALLASTLLLVATAHIACLFVSSYEAVLALRLIMLFFAAVFTPQAASCVALLVPEKERAGAIAFVFIGWSLSVAAGLPLVTFLAANFGWQVCLAMLGVASLLCAGLIAATIPRGLRGAPFSLASWGQIFSNPLIVLLLIITAVQVSGQFLIITFMAPLLQILAGAGANIIATFFLIYGVGGFFGSVIATRLVSRLGAYRTSGIAIGGVLIGLLLWSFGAGALIVMGLGAAIWGLGFAAANGMQQARLHAAAPALAGVSVALNTSSIYIGQAAGSYLGGLLFTRGFAPWMGYAGALLVLGSLVLWRLTRPPASTA